MSAPQTARERFEAWFIAEYGEGSYAFKNFAWYSWQAAERSAIERAAKVAEEMPDCLLRVYARGLNDPPVHQWVTTKREHLIKAIRSLIT